jgi:hypothetical protein
MSKNPSFNYADISGIFCQCGNAEVITDDNPRYHRFSTWRDKAGGLDCFKAACLKCHSEPCTPDLRPRPVDLRERLQAAYPDADVDELLAKCTIAQ